MLPDPDVQNLDPVLRRDWHVAAYASSLQDNNPLGVKLLGVDVVIWKSSDGLRAAKNLCRHRGMAFTDLQSPSNERFEVDRVIDGNLVCPYHGWEYNADGQCVRFPYDLKRKPPKSAQLLGEYAVQEAYGWIWVCLEPGYQDIPEFPEWPDDGFGKVASGPYPVRAAAQRFVENFLDVAHFPYVHRGKLGTLEYPEVPDYEAYYDDTGVYAKDIKFYQPNPDGSGKGGWENYNYRVYRPLSVYFAKEYEGRIFTLFCHATPTTADTSIVWMNMAMNYPFDARSTIEFQDFVSGQDIPIVESQRPELLPLDLTAELSMGADKASIMYRKYLKALGVTYGTA
ncbi:MAG: aromatic ring-hydroxylating dioxygenase subunit alpha [Chloroflexi bacterium]|nr:MAG: aromatic ring-hydroxylating dioxygenase subunit alpha [Chloroflexota bacterium]